MKKSLCLNFYSIRINSKNLNKHIFRDCEWKQFDNVDEEE